MVDAWIVRSLPVPTAVVQHVWPDRAWRTPLRDAVIFPLGNDGTAGTASAGVLRQVELNRGLGLVTLGGESVWLDRNAIFIPHPVLLFELDDFRRPTCAGPARGASE